MKYDDNNSNNEKLIGAINRNIQRLLSERGYTQQELAYFLNISPTKVSRALLRGTDDDKDYTGRGQKFNIYELNQITKFFNITFEELITGIAPNNKEEHIKTGLDNIAINWLKSIKDKKPYLLETINLILGNEEIANAMFEAIYLYAVSSIPPTYFKKEGTVTERQARTIADDDLLLRYAIVGSFEEILKLIKKEYERIPDNYNKRMQEEKLHSIYESLRLNLQRVSEKSYEIDVENGEEILDFDKEAEEYNKN